MQQFQPGYIELNKSIELRLRVADLKSMLGSCSLCPRNCGINRLNNEKGYCNAGAEVEIASYFTHFGEEPPLIGKYGSGTIFFTHCHLRCSFCQNADISKYGKGRSYSTIELANMMLNLQRQNCHNINLVSPTHYVPQIVDALSIAVRNGLDVPLVFNCSGYESLEVLQLLDGVVDIYLPDVKFNTRQGGHVYLNASDYSDIWKPVIREMHRQVGDLQLNDLGVAVKGLMVRHLVMPGDITASNEIMKFIAEEISTNTYINIMQQYQPYDKALTDKVINRSIRMDEFQAVVQQARSYGLHRGF
ncbi:radical SAM protein [candidate division KSB1 bacterium]|nr:radical SAM protein [candidate division KSB1 bacterium]